MDGFQSLKYMDGFGGHFTSEALPGALPVGQNTPQFCPYGLYAEQISGTAFTAPRHKNLRTWVYRILPSVLHNKLEPCKNQKFLEDFESLQIDPSQFRWDPYSFPGENTEVDFVDGLQLNLGAGDPSVKEGLAIYMYSCNISMNKKAFYSADGDFLIVPQAGTLYITTELGRYTVAPKEIIVIPRGIKFSVNVEGPTRGYVAELFKGHFELPGLGPIGSNGLANPRDFKTACAFYEDDESEHVIVGKFINKLYQATLNHSPFDVVAWHGNYTPFKYDLTLFNTVNSVSYDHLDPCIFTVLTAQTDEPGTAALDFVIFPPRWMVQENTFRPPYYHRNCMSEYMGMIEGMYDAKGKAFAPGGGSLHSCMTAHGPDAATFAKASTEELNPVKFTGGLAFMFESSYLLKVSKSALTTPHLQANYIKCWNKLPKLFNGEKNPSINWNEVKEKVKDEN